MNNTQHRPSGHVVEPNASVSLAPASRNGNEAVRDFFRRGDRGTYDGGPADHALESLPSWDLPERAPIIRTPKQQARRVAAMWAEAALMLGCVVFLVAAALKASGNSSTRSATSNLGQPSPGASARTIARSQVAPAEPANPSPPVIARVGSNAPLPVQSARAALPVSPAANLPPALSVATNTVVAERRTVMVTPPNPNPVSQRAQIPRHSYPSGASKRTELPSAPSPAVPRRAVAAFPDD